MARTNNLSNFLTDVADAIKTKKGSQTAIPAANFDTEINNIITVNNQNKTVNPSTSQQIVTPDASYTGLGQVTVNAVTNAIDANIQPGNIKYGVTILGISGSLEEGEMNIYTQTTEPTTKQGIWIQSNSYTYSGIEEVNNLNNLSPSKINFLKQGTDYNYSTIMSNDNLTYNFDGVYPTDSNGDILYDSPKVYYGNGTNWIDITPQQVKIAGIHADFANSQFTRIEDSTNWSAGSDFDMHGSYQRYRCIVTDSGIELARYGETGYTETGFLEQAITKDGTTYPVGTEVQVMVRQPKVWYKVDNVVLDSNDNVSINSCDYLVADGPVEGFSLHPAFIMDGQEIDRLYYPAFEGTLYDYSSTSYTGGETTTIDYAVDKLSSVKGSGSLTPRVSITRANARTLANNRGNGWSQITMQMVELERLLMTIEYASFNHQSVLARGVVDSSAATVGRVTTFNSSGTGLAGASSSTSDSFTWRWQENIYGNVWKWNDGVNVVDRLFYVADHNFADNTTTGYTTTGIIMTSTNNYISRFGYNQNCDWVFIPTQANGTASQPIGDYCYSMSGNKMIISGGVWDAGSQAGVFCVYADFDSSDAAFYVAAALAARFIDS